MPRPSPWNSPTRSVRLPEHAIDACLELARKLDGVELAGNVQNDLPDLSGPSTTPTDPYLVTIGQERYMVQTPASMTTKQWAAAAQLVDQLWAELAHLSDDQRWYVFSRLVQEWGQEGRLPDAA